MKNLASIMLLLLLPVFVSAQPQETQLEILHRKLKNAANDTIRMDVFLNLALYYNTISSDSALFYLAKGLPISQELKLKLYEVHFLENRGYMLTRVGNYPKALESFLAALEIAEDPASEKYAWNLVNGQTPRKERLTKLGYLHLTMGHLFGATNNRAKQISSYNQVKAIAESIQETALLSVANWNLGRAYVARNKLDSALLYNKAALDLKGPYRGGVLNSIGYIYEAKGEFELALDAYQNALIAANEENNLYGIAASSVSLGSLYLFLDKPDSGFFYGKKALEISKITLNHSSMANAYQLISNVYDKQGKGDSAYLNLKLSVAIRDSLNNHRIENLLVYQSIGFDEQFRLQKLEEERIKTQAENRIFLLLTGLTLFIIIAFLLFRNNKNKQKANKLLREQKKEIQTTLEQLVATQSQLIHSEKMASLGELTAGIAHEIQNPLNFVNNFSEVNKELISEMKDEIEKKNFGEVKEIANDIEVNEEKINHHGKRAESIVKGMLLHSRGSSGEKEPTDINALCDEYLRLAYHGFRAKDKSFNADYKLETDESLPKINVVPQDISRVLLNLINNAFYAVSEKAKQNIKNYEPEVKVKTSLIPPSVGGAGGALISVKDNGSGIPNNIKDKIFQPFFTTKSTGVGTGLGLSLSYDIIKSHGGEIKVVSAAGNGTEFKTTIPFKK